MEMRFTEQEIKAAQQLEELGLQWTPQAGHYVFDPTEFCKAPSPFQDRVYFILNYPYFMKAAGGLGLLGKVQDDEGCTRRRGLAPPEERLRTRRAAGSKAPFLLCLSDSGC